MVNANKSVYFKKFEELLRAIQNLAAYVLRVSVFADVKYKNTVNNYD